MIAELVNIKLKTGDKEIDSLISARWKPVHGIRLIQGIEDVLTRDNFPVIYKNGQGEWKPLNEEYKRRKVAEGYSPEIWKRTGNSFKALTTPVQIKVNGGRVSGRSVVITENSGGVVRATHTMEKKTAGGYFAKNNESRKLVYVLASAGEKIKAKVTKMFLQDFAKSGFKVTGRQK
ncbi:MAG: hypothetical protein M3447_09040 [Acidobacteriota bacterium]|nr:hypothetical protein [Acidobacteriota bacterium]